jgi:uncharacterized protein YjiS (DUF1127 family)
MIEVLNRISSRIKARSTERQLHALPDYILKDIGLTRSEIAYVARGSKPLDQRQMGERSF